jgi:regulator of extracellular matrix RemA (YlzA/DUF370 family)
VKPRIGRGNQSAGKRPIGLVEQGYRSHHLRTVGGPLSGLGKAPPYGRRGREAVARDSAPVISAIQPAPPASRVGMSDRRRRAVRPKSEVSARRLVSGLPVRHGRSKTGWARTTTMPTHGYAVG